uniref:MADF domain-containing protein n=1 Tax=Stomoxys calcitrans TaxID=35570 RepID=A0A1I8PK66_STOCA
MQKTKIKSSRGEKKSLIKIVKNYPAIWDKHHIDNSNRKQKQLAWANVAKLMNLNENYCRTIWRSIQDSYRYFKRKLERQSDGYNLEDEYSSDDSFTRNFSFKKDLEFLDPFTNFNSSARKSSSVRDEDMACDEKMTRNEEMTRDEEMNRDEEMTRDEYISPYFFYANAGPNDPMCHEVEEIIVEYSEEDDELTDPIPHTTNVSDTTETNIETKRCKDSIDSRSNKNKDSSLDSRSNNYKDSLDTHSNHEYRSAAISTSNSKRQGHSKAKDDTFIKHMNTLFNKLPLESSENLQAKFMAIAYAELVKNRDT